MIVTDLQGCAFPREIVVTLGTFDGVHRGHRALLDQVKRAAAERGVKSLVLTFPQPPQNRLSGKPKKPLILPPAKKLELIEGCGIDAVVMVEFEAISWMSAAEFAKRVLKDRLQAAEVVVGYDCRFGKDRAGDKEALRALGRELGFQVKIIEPVVVDGVIVSSTEVRQAIQAGDVERAARLLGYAPLLCGQVIGRVGRGEGINSGTVRLDVDESIVTPDEGVFFVRATFQEREEPGVMRVRRGCSLGSNNGCLEVELLSCKVEGARGAKIEVELLKKLQEARKNP